MIPDLSPYEVVLPNLRDVGNQPVASPPGSKTRSGLLYRSAAPMEGAAAALQALGVTHVFDLRSDIEIDREGGQSAADACSQVLPACQRYHVAVFKKEDYTPEAIALRFQDYSAEDNTAGFVSAYQGILRSGALTAFAPILKHLSSPSPTPCLVHCTAGKDRTGLLCAMVLELCGVSDEDIASEYGLTEVGLAPLKKGIMERLMAAPGASIDESAAMRMLSSRPQVMLAILKVMREEYGSIEGYVKDHCKLSDEEIARLRQNMTVKADTTPNGSGAASGAAVL